MSTPPPVEVEQLSLRIGERVLFADLSFTVSAGELAVLRGESGTGKTSLLRCLLGFTQPASGRIRLWGELLSPRTVGGLRRRLAYVPQEPPLGGGTVEEVLQRPLAYRANAGIVWQADAAAALFERLRLPTTLLGEPVAGLSGGERQRVALASVLLLRRSLLLLDEPTAALDARSSDAVIELLRSLDGVAVLAVSHADALAAAAARTLTLSPPASPAP